MITRVYKINPPEFTNLGYPRRGAEVEYLGPAYRRNGAPMKRMHGGRYVGYSRIMRNGVVSARRNDLIEIEVAR
ncbi:hypothetical protein LQF12_02345 [Ruania suaedae]|uniref:hypothetical protein n=1 Tax=Ruania suaedae TaxID=2897774 RepID=UPI001E40657F|nr:hypothetical protein [Ruania suaedae]UFU03473.1 hypothetical protein LQF12_02345 [Ruania suaedae]